MQRGSEELRIAQLQSENKVEQLEANFEKHIEYSNSQHRQREDFLNNELRLLKEQAEIYKGDVQFHSKES